MRFLELDEEAKLRTKIREFYALLYRPARVEVSRTDSVGRTLSSSVGSLQFLAARTVRLDTFTSMRSAALHY